MKKDEELFLLFVGKQIRRIRLKKGLTLEQVEQLGYSSWRHLQKCETGKDFTLSTLYRICKAIEINPIEIFIDYGLKDDE